MRVSPEKISQAKVTKKSETENLTTYWLHLAATQVALF